MSRTYKDKDYYLRFPEEKWDFSRYKPEGYPYVSMLEIAGKRTKKSRRYDGTWRYYERTPSWWIREFMTAPKRRACRDWEKEVVKVSDLEEVDTCPDYGRKPHKYFW